jgi:NTE family protein
MGALVVGRAGLLRRASAANLPAGQQPGRALLLRRLAAQSLLEKLVDFDLLNACDLHFSVGATQVRTGNLIIFDSASHKIGPEHIMASGSLPPGFPSTEIDGEHYWDGGLVSNTPLQWVLDAIPRQDTLAFQIDL